MNNIHLKMYETGYCYNLEKIAYQKGKWKKVKFPAIVGLIKHPTAGYILFDTGYGDHFFTASKKFPYILYRFATPVVYQKEKSISYQLQQNNISPESIQYIFLSHFHGDHVGGLKDFPNATIICSKVGFHNVKNKKGFSAVKKGFLPDTLPIDFEMRSIFLEDKEKTILPKELFPFEEGYDVLGDGSLYAVNVEGHAKGQYGLFIKRKEDTWTFLCADSVWSSDAYKNNVRPHFFARFIMDSYTDYISSFQRVSSLYDCNKNIEILPTHCSDVWEKINKGDFV